MRRYIIYDLPLTKIWILGCCDDGALNRERLVLIILRVIFVCQPRSSDASLYASLEPFIVRIRMQRGYTRMCILEHPII